MSPLSKKARIFLIVRRSKKTTLNHLKAPTITLKFSNSKQKQLIYLIVQGSLLYIWKKIKHNKHIKCYTRPVHVQLFSLIRSWHLYKNKYRNDWALSRVVRKSTQSLFLFQWWIDRYIFLFQFHVKNHENAKSKSKLYHCSEKKALHFAPQLRILTHIPD